VYRTVLTIAHITCLVKDQELNSALPKVEKTLLKVATLTADRLSVTKERCCAIPAPVLITRSSGDHPVVSVFVSESTGRQRTLLLP
jgi:hypothetical protein